MLIDTHSHLHVKEFDADRDEVISRARAAGVDFIAVGFEPEGNKKAQALGQQYGVPWTCGVHPHNANEATDETLAWMFQAKKDAKNAKPGAPLVAIGEMGLDFFKNFQPREMQIAAFKKQLALARELKLPVIIHCRDAFAETFEILKEEGNREVVFHCFTGGQEETQICLERGYFLSFTGICTYPQAAEVRAAVERAPIDRIMIESDCPFLAPQSQRGKRNEPAFLRETFAKISEIKNVPKIYLEEQFMVNTKLFFHLDRPLTK